MKLVLLGTAGYHPSDQRHTSCVFLPEIGVAFDAGTSFYRVRDRLVTSTLDVFLTHAHLDHAVGLTFLLNVVHGKGVTRTTVHGEDGKLSSLREHLFHPDLFPALPAIEWRPLRGELTLSDGGRLHYWPQRHPGGSLGYRIDWPDRSVALVTDTVADPDADYVSHLRGVDLLIHECNFPDGQEAMAELTGHSCASPVAEVARCAAVGRLVLTHFDPLADPRVVPDLDRLRGIFPRTEVAYDNMAIEL